MPADDHLLDDVADAILDGTPIDWARVESLADASRRRLLDRLKVLASLADVHRDLPHVSTGQDNGHGALGEAIHGRAAELGQWGHLRLIEPIGRGAFGQVFRARDTRLDRDVALKLLPAHSAAGETSATAIIEEGRLLAQVRHPNVVTIYGAERIGDSVGLWMELLAGRTLEQILEEGRRFTVAEALGIGIQICGAVSAVHHAGVLHRDIKSHNVILSNDGRVVLMDFGTGYEMGDSSSARLAGTPLYLAPELLAGQEPTVRSDIYSLGVLLYHLVTRSYPVRAQNLDDLRLAHEHRERGHSSTVRPAIPPKLARVIERAIEHRPERRYQTVDALRADLAALKARSKRAVLTYASAVAAVVVVGVAIGWEASGRLAGWSRTPIALLGDVFKLSPVSGGNVDPAGQPVIAVLPLENLSGQADAGYLADALTDGLIRDLAVIQGLQVRSRTSSFAFKDQPRNLRVVGAQLGVNLVVEGSVSRSGHRLRINARLVQVAGDVPVWAARFDRDASDLFAIQDEISRAIVDTLRLSVTTVQRRYDMNIDTYILYLKARAYLGRRGGADAKAAGELFQQLVDKDPTFAPAYAGLAEAYGLMSHPTLSRGIVESAIPRMEQAARKALQLDEFLAEGHAAMGFVQAWQTDWENAQQSFRRAIDLNPSLTQTYINYWTTTLLPLERLDEAEGLLKAAMRTDPLSPTVHHEMGFLKLVAGRFDEAIDHYTRARALDPQLPYLDQHLGRALTFAGRFSEALSLWDTKMDPNGKGYWKDQPGAQNWMATAYVMAGRRAAVERMADAPGEPYRKALFWAALGDKDRTFEELNRAAEIVPHRVRPLLAYPEMRLLRGDRRLAALRKKLHLP